MAYKVEVQVIGEPGKWQSNHKEYPVLEEAERAAVSLWSRWGAVERYRVVKVKPE